MKVIVLTSAGVPHGRSRGGEHLRAADQTRQALRPARRDPQRLRTSAPCPSARGSAGRVRAPPGRSATFHILVAEDNPTNQKLVILLLEGRGHRVTTVNNGRQAVAKAIERAYDVILMDVQMPEMGGFEATDAIRRHERDGRRAHPNRRDDGARHGRRSRTVPRLGHGRLRLEAAQGRRTARHGGPRRRPGRPRGAGMEGLTRGRDARHRALSPPGRRERTSRARPGRSSTGARCSPASAAARRCCGKSSACS